MTPENEAKKEVREGLQKLGYKVIRMQSGQARVRGGMMHFAPAGTPDLLTFDRNGLLMWVECKAAFAKKRKDQPEQQAFAEWAHSVGHRYCLARSMDDVLAYLAATAS